MTKNDMPIDQNLLKDKIYPKVARWIAFSIIAALLPLIWKIVASLFSGGTVSINSTCSGGELFLISTTLASVSIGDLIASGNYLKIFKIILGGVSFVLMIVTSLCFTFIATNGTSAIAIDTISQSSLGLFIATIISSTTGVAIAEV